jgi:20S proteasome alpha/beta subunit
MTYILGSRCNDGVVLVADTRFTIDQLGGIGFMHDNDKIFAGISGMIMGFSGTRGKFELFKTAIYYKSQILR